LTIPALLERVLPHARTLRARSLLLRFDSGYDAIENIAVITAHKHQHSERARRRTTSLNATRTRNAPSSGSPTPKHTAKGNSRAPVSVCPVKVRYWPYAAAGG
jgi:hypothetical protein